MALTIRERCERRLPGLKAMRQPRDAECAEIARLAAPSRTRFLKDGPNREGARPVHPIDGYGIRSFRTLTAGMTSGLSSPSRPWFKLTTDDEDLSQDAEVKAWLEEVEHRMEKFLAKSKFYEAAQTGYGEVGLFGTEACVMVENPKVGLVYHPLTFGEYWIACGDTTEPDTLYRQVPMSVKTAVDTFGSAVSPSVMSAYDRSDYDQQIECFHAIEPNDDREAGRLDYRGKAFRSVWWDTNDQRTRVLRHSGYEEKPFWAARWNTTGSDTWGSSPGQDALPDLRVLQLQAKRKNEAIDWLIWPEKIVPATVTLRNQPKSVVTAASVDKQNVIIPYEMRPEVVTIIQSEIDRNRLGVDMAAYADLFNAITNMPGIQPRNVEEIAARNEEKLTQLGPVIERMNSEKLQVAIDRTFGMMMRGGLLPDAPESLHGRDLGIDFVSILTQMQRMVGIGQIERFASFVGNITAVYPEAADKLDVDAMVGEYRERTGAPSTMVRTDEQVQQIRDARAQAQNAEKMAAMAPAMQQGADAARLMSETDMGNGNNLLSQIMPT